MKKCIIGLLLLIGVADALACPTCGSKKKKQQQQALQMQDMQVDTATFAPVDDEPMPVKKWRNNGKKPKTPVIYSAEFQDQE